MRPTGSPHELERRRLQAINLLNEGFAPVAVARRLGVDRRSVRRWRAAYEKKGRKALEARPASGRPPKLCDKDKRRLETLLLKGARAHGFHTNLWTCPRVAELINRKFGVQYHADHIGRLLRSMNWSPQKPERRARERNEEVIQGWIKKDWRRIKKTLRK